METREVVPLDYADKRTAAPFDWSGSIRQLVFAAGVGFIAGGLIACLQREYEVWSDGQVLWIGFGAGMIALTIPWPGRIGWRPER